MRFAIAVLASLIPAAAFAQQVQPITLTPQEYQATVAELMGRDPILRMLVTKQDGEQARAATAAKADKPAAAKAEAKPATETEGK